MRSINATTPTHCHTDRGSPSLEIWAFLWKESLTRCCPTPARKAPLAGCSEVQRKPRWNVIKPSYRTDAMSQTAFSPSGFFFFPFYPQKVITLFPLTSSHIPTTPPFPLVNSCTFLHYLVRISQGAWNAKKKRTDQVPRFSWLFIKVSLNETHSDRDSSVIMLHIWSDQKK